MTAGDFFTPRYPPRIRFRFGCWGQDIKRKSNTAPATTLVGAFKFSRHRIPPGCCTCRRFLCWRSVYSRALWIPKRWTFVHSLRLHINNSIFVFLILGIIEKSSIKRICCPYLTFVLNELKIKKLKERWNPRPFIWCKNL